MRGPKLTVLGAGSFFFGKPVIKKMATSDVMKGGTLALVDTDPEALDVMMRLAKRVLDGIGSDVKLLGSTDRREVMADSDFVVLTFSHKNAYFRGVDTEVAAKHGIRMCSSDTIGPGGIFRAMRELPRVMAVVEDVRKLCPKAWVVNFINPTSVIGIGLMRYASDVRSFALCDGHHEPRNILHWLKTGGIIPEDAECVPPEVYNKLDLAIGGVNHCTWVIRFSYDGVDLMPKIREKLGEWAAKERESVEAESKARYNFTYGEKMFDVYGAYPTAMGHTKEYVPFFQGYGARPVDPEPIGLFNAEGRMKLMAEAWETTRQYADGGLSVEEFLEKTPADHASDIIENMWGGLGKQFYINSANRGAVTNMPVDAFLELRCDVDMHGPRPQRFGDVPRGLLGLFHQVLDAHELTAQAALTGDRKLLKRAMLTDPIVNNISDADACIEELLVLEREALPDYWYK